MQSLVSIAAKVVAGNCAVEAVLDLPVELRDYLQPRYDKLTQLKHFRSWIFEQKIDNVQCTVKVVYQDKYTTVYLWSSLRGLVSEFLLYDGQLHGEFIFYDKDGSVCIEIYKLGTILSIKRIFPDRTPHYSIDFTGGRREIMYFRPGGKGQIDVYGYYSKSCDRYVLLIRRGEIVRGVSNMSKYTERALPDWIGELIKMV
jgi:hypothetical protein